MAQFSTFDPVSELQPRHNDDFRRLRAAERNAPLRGRARRWYVSLRCTDLTLLEALQNHGGVESAIVALQSGNGMKRCRDRSEIDFERSISLAILGRLQITNGSPESEGAFSRGKAA